MLRLRNARAECARVSVILDSQFYIDIITELDAKNMKSEEEF